MTNNDEPMKFNKRLLSPNPESRFLDKAITIALSPEEFREIRREANISMLQFAHKHLSADEFYAMIPKPSWFITSLTSKEVRLSASSESVGNEVDRYATYKSVNDITECSLSITRELRGSSVNFRLMERTRDNRPDLVFVKVEIPSKTHNGSVFYLYKRHDGVVEVKFSGNDSQHRKYSPQADKDARSHFKGIDFDTLNINNSYRDKIFGIFREFAIFGTVDDLIKGK